MKIGTFIVNSWSICNVRAAQWEPRGPKALLSYKADVSYDMVRA